MFYNEREPSLAKKIASLEQAVRDIKTKQKYGVKAAKTYVNETSVFQSHNFNSFGVYTAEYMYKDIVFQADNQLSPFGRLALDLRFGSSSTPATDADGLTILSYLFIPTNENDGMLKWRVYIQGPKDTDFYCIFKVIASDSGTVSVTDTIAAGEV